MRISYLRPSLGEMEQFRVRGKLDPIGTHMHNRNRDEGPSAGSTFRFNRRRLLRSSIAGISSIGMIWPVAALAQRKSSPGALLLARIVGKVSFGDLPPTAIKHAKMILASTLASAASGSQIESVRIIRDLAKEQGGKRDAPVWFGDARLPVTEAARVNAMLSDSAASDDSDLRNVAHTGTCLTSVGLAIGERVGANGQDILSATVAGYEATGRVGEALAASGGSTDGASGAISGS